jgi:glycosyltransferase involved in cell wall biosynthesis
MALEHRSGTEVNPLRDQVPELSVVIPCLNEAKTVAGCVREAVAAFAQAGIAGEVIVSDNGSTDGSQQLATEAGARVVPATRRGYGAALMAGIEAARGEFIVMGDADGSYNFGDSPRLVSALRGGAHLAQGCRLPAGGGSVDRGAMPWSHRWIGNPGLTWLARRMFGTPVHDVYCGLRGFRRDLYDRLALRCTGMEFATEMIIKAALHRVPTAEVSTTLRRDGRGGRPPHLRTFRDGWRTLRLFLLFSQRWVHLIPGGALLLGGLLLGAAALVGARFGEATLGAHTMLVASASILVGLQSLWIGLFARTFASIEGMAPRSQRLSRLQRGLSLERSLVWGGTAVLLGLAFVGKVFLDWQAAGYGPLDYPDTLRWVIPGITLVALGVQTITGGFALSLLTLERK